jgi:hypothetical protein
MPPAPISASTSYGPRRSPGFSDFTRSPSRLPFYSRSRDPLNPTIHLSGRSIRSLIRRNGHKRRGVRADGPSTEVS